MKCPNCGGTGEVKLDSGIFTRVSKCDQCGGSGIIDPQTNEEWLRSATTEQLADVFFDYRYVNSTPRQKLWMSASEKCIKTDIVEWLKQPHTFK